MGKTAPVVGLLLFALMAAMYFLSGNAWMVFALALVAVTIVVAYLGLAFWYGHRHPDAAVLEGAELVRYREVELAAKDPRIIDVSPEGRANVSPPGTLTHGGRSDG